MSSSSLKSVNPNAEIMGKQAALFMNINAAKGLQDVMKSNLGPKGTIKMLVGGAGGESQSHDSPELETHPSPNRVTTRAIGPARSRRNVPTFKPKAARSDARFAPTTTR